jgi:hypothetical protein
VLIRAIFRLLQLPGLHRRRKEIQQELKDELMIARQTAQEQAGQDYFLRKALAETEAEKKRRP